MMNTHLDLRRAVERPFELRAEAAADRLARSATAPLSSRVAQWLHVLAERLDGGRGARQPGGGAWEDLRSVVHAFR